MRLIPYVFGSLLMAVPLISAAAINPSTDKFPHRSKYDVTIIETADLKKRFNQVVMVDVRSKYEYQTLHVKGAVNVPVAHPKFGEEIRRLVRENPDKAIVFYCNGTTCQKSYEAATRCEALRIKNTIAYDAGIFQWANDYPELTVLLGRTAKPGDFISDEEFKRHVISPAHFKQLVEQSAPGQATVLDIRDRSQRDVLLWPRRAVRAQLDDQQGVNQTIEKAKNGRSMLLVFDEAGHQVRWFQYYLKDKGVTNYRFMSGGSQGYREAERTGKLEMPTTSSSLSR
jgi:rhodanese-related sulfurtransferase